MTALIVLGAVAGALVSTALVQWFSTQMQEWRDRW